jgi:hypothetical protein
MYERTTRQDNDPGFSGGRGCPLGAVIGGQCEEQ